MEFLRRLGVALATLAAVSSLRAQPISLRDGAGLTVTLAAPARRVAALISSTTDIIVSLGAADRIVARTRYDTASVVATAANVGGGIDPSVEVLIAARPDLFIAWNGQANTAVVSRMRALGVPVYLVDTRDTTALFATIRDLGALLGLNARASAAATSLRADLRGIASRRANRPRVSAVYVISRTPVIIAAARSYMAELISVAGGDNPFRDVQGEFPTLSLEAFIARDPDVIITGRPEAGASQLERLRATPGWRDLRAVRQGAVIEVDGEQWGRPTLRFGALLRDLAQQLELVAPLARQGR